MILACQTACQGESSHDVAISDDATLECRREEARVSAHVWELFSFCFLNPPSADVARSMASLISILRADAGEEPGEEAGDEQGEEQSERRSKKIPSSAEASFDVCDVKQAYYDRFFVASSGVFIPLTESRVRDARRTKDGWAFDSVGGHYRVQVEQCYANAGFDYKKLQGFEPFVSAMDADNIAAEAAFMAHLRLMESRATSKEAAVGYASTATRFLSTHLYVWAVKLAEIAASRGIDYYSHIISALPVWAELETT